MACPECTIDIPRRKDKQHFSWEYFEEAAKYFRGAFGTITLSGGEATVHPQFKEFAPKLRELFQPLKLNVETNGFGFTRFPEVFSHFDEVVCTIYRADSFDGCPDNAAKIAAYKAHYGEDSNLRTGRTVFVPRRLRPGTKPCAKLGILSYCNGILFPCCLGPGLERVVGVRLTPTWRNDIAKSIAPCDGCFFALP